MKKRCLQMNIDNFSGNYFYFRMRILANFHGTSEIAVLRGKGWVVRSTQSAQGPKLDHSTLSCRISQVSIREKSQEFLTKLRDLVIALGYLIIHRYILNDL